MFDGDHSVLSVTGDFTMAVEPNMNGSHFGGKSATKHYRAGLFWDGTGLQLITLEGVLG